MIIIIRSSKSRVSIIETKEEIQYTETIAEDGKARVFDYVVNDSGSQATAAMDTEEVFLSHDDAIELLHEKNAGLKPDLSRLVYRFVKRAFDLVVSGAAIIVLFIPALILCAAICIKSPGASPVYSQVRVGRLRKNGTFRLFRMYKFRSMVPHADEMLANLREDNEADGPLFKIKEDPRIIKGLGPFIRRHSIDEGMNLINVFLGDMSLIGPRPALPAEVAQYDERSLGRLVVKPGCGGVWQTTSRSDSTFGEMVTFDLDYIEHRSIGYDLKLMFETVRAVFKGEGAY